MAPYSPVPGYHLVIDVPVSHRSGLDIFFSLKATSSLPSIITNLIPAFSTSPRLLERRRKQVFFNHLAILMHLKLQVKVDWSPPPLNSFPCLPSSSLLLLHLLAFNFHASSFSCKAWWPYCPLMYKKVQFSGFCRDRTDGSCNKCEGEIDRTRIVMDFPPKHWVKPYVALSSLSCYRLYLLELHLVWRNVF